MDFKQISTIAHNPLLLFSLNVSLFMKKILFLLSCHQIHFKFICLNVFIFMKTGEDKSCKKQHMVIHPLFTKLPTRQPFVVVGEFFFVYFNLVHVLVAICSRGYYVVLYFSHSPMTSLSLCSLLYRSISVFPLFHLETLKELCTMSHYGKLYMSIRNACP